VKPTDLALIAAGATASMLLALASGLATGPAFVIGLESRAQSRLEGSGVTASFRDSRGWLTRHPTLSGGDALHDTRRAALASAVAALPGIGGARWAYRPRPVTASGAEKPPALHCQEGVDGVLKARTIRFAEASAAIDPTSEAVLDEVAAALKPCLGSVIAITGHTDAAGDEAPNLALSQQRAESVRAGLIVRGIPAGGLRARGLGSAQPQPDLDPADPANRRIEFDVLTITPPRPTPVDTPGAG
jgi:OmpA-OmpF porin, OOP family